MSITNPQVSPVSAGAAASERPVRALFICSQWPTAENPSIAPFVPREVNSMRAAGVELDTLLYAGGFNPVNYVKAVRQMRRMIREKDYDLIHVYFGQCAVVGRAQWKLPVVITYGGTDVEGTPSFSGFNRWKDWLVVGISRVMSLLVDEVIVVSDNLGRKLPRKDYHVITTVLDIDRFVPGDQLEARKKLGLPLDLNHKLALFCASSLTNSVKRYWLAQAAAEIAAESMDMELVAASQRPPEEIPLFMQACDTLLLTSLREGSPNVVRESLASNLPVVATDCGDVRERLAHVPGCEVVASDDPAEIAAALVRVLQHPVNQPRNLNLRQEVSDQGPDVLGKRVLEIYRKAIDKRLQSRRR